MRVPFTKVYRAFPELDGMSDRECRRLLRRAVVRHGVPRWPGPVAAVAALVGWVWLAFVAPFGLGVSVPSFWIPGRAGTVWADIRFLAAGPVAGVLVAALAGMVARDLTLRRVVWKTLHAARCRKCGYALVGARPLPQGGLEPRPGDARVRCPECGRIWVLMDLGLTMEDLVPWEQRALGEEVGKMKRVRWETAHRG